LYKPKAVGTPKFILLGKGQLNFQILRSAWYLYCSNSAPMTLVWYSKLLLY